MAKAVRIPRIRTGQGVWPLPRKEFERRFLERYFDPRFELERGEIEKLTELAWRNYCETRKAPRDAQGRPGFEDPGLRTVRSNGSRRARRCAPPQRRQRKAGDPFARTAGLRRLAQRRDLPRRDVQDLAPGDARERGAAGAAASRWTCST